LTLNLTKELTETEKIRKTNKQIRVAQPATLKFCKSGY
jgi:hypothetical protein